MARFSLLSALLCAVTLPAAAQVEVRVVLGANGAHSTTISNLGTESVARVVLTLAGGQWDSFVGSGFTVADGVNPNDNVTRAAAADVTLAPALSLAGAVVASGDTDDAVTGLTAEVTWSSGARAVAVGAQQGGTWVATAQLTAPERPVTLSWVPPATNEDGSPYLDPAGYWLYRAAAPPTAAVASFVSSHRVLDAAATSYVLSAPEGTWYFFMQAVNAVGVSSAYSNVVQKQVTAPAQQPAAPTNLQVTVADLPVYAPLLTRNAQSMIQVGTVPQGAACDGAQSVSGFNAAGTLYLVRVEDVALFPGVFPEAVFAACEVAP